MALQSQQTPLRTPRDATASGPSDHRVCCTGKYLSFQVLSSLSGMTRPYPPPVPQRPLDEPCSHEQLDSNNAVPTTEGGSPVLSKMTGSIAQALVTLVLSVLKVQGLSPDLRRVCVRPLFIL